MNFSQVIQALRARFRLIVFTLMVTVGTTALVTCSMPKTYSADTKVVIGFGSVDPFSDSALPMQFSSTYMNTQIEILGSHRVARKAVELLGLKDSTAFRDEFLSATEDVGDIQDSLAAELLENLEVEPSRDSRIITIIFSSPNPRLSAVAANAFAQSYIETTLEMSVEPARQASVWFNQQVKALRNNVSEAQAKQTAYQQEHGIVVTDERLDMHTAMMGTLSNHLVNAQEQTYEAESNLQQIIALEQSGSSLESLPEVLSNSFIQNLRSDLLKQKILLDELSRQLGANHPQYIRALNEANSTKAKLNGEIRAVFAAVKDSVVVAKQRVKDLEKAVEEQKQKILELKQSHDAINVFQREVTNAQAIYDSAMKRYNQTSMESQVNQTDVAVLSEAVLPTRPSSPKVMQNIILSIILGVMLSLGLAILLELLDRRVRGEVDLTNGLGLPLIGTLEREIE